MELPRIGEIILVGKKRSLRMMMRNNIFFKYSNEPKGVTVIIWVLRRKGRIKFNITVERNCLIDRAIIFGMERILIITWRYYDEGAEGLMYGYAFPVLPAHDKLNNCTVDGRMALCSSSEQKWWSPFDLTKCVFLFRGNVDFNSNLFRVMYF